MEQVQLMVGVVRTTHGVDTSDYRIVTFRGEQLGWTREYLDDRQNRWRDIEFYVVCTEDIGGFVVSEARRSRWEGEEDTYCIHYYKDIVSLGDEWRLELERAGVVPRRRVTLREYLAEGEE